MAPLGIAGGASEPQDAPTGEGASGLEEDTGCSPLGPSFTVTLGGDDQSTAKGV